MLQLLVDKGDNLETPLIKFLLVEQREETATDEDKPKSEFIEHSFIIKNICISVYYKCLNIGYDCRLFRRIWLFGVTVGVKRICRYTWFRNGCPSFTDGVSDTLFTNGFICV